MSWIEKVNENLVITTGDGKEYRPLWVDAQRSKDFNIGEFEFPNEQGALIRRKNPKAVRYSLTIFFQGEDNIEQADAFWESANDNRPWEISHPFYRTLTVQPSNLQYDDSEFNRTNITSTVIETNLQKGVESSTNIENTVKQGGDNVNEEAAQSFATNVQPDSNLVTEMGNKINNVESAAQGQFPGTEAASTFTNAVNEATRAIQSAANEPLIAMKTIQGVINAPANFEDTVENRLNILDNQFQELRNNIGSSRQSKTLFETQQSANLSAQCQTAVTPQEGEYTKREDVINVAERIVANFDTFLEDLVSIQSDRAGDPTSYIPNPVTQRNLMGLIDLTTSNLFDLAFNLKREKVFKVRNDTNIFILAHKLYGLDANDENVSKLIAQNNLSINEHFVIPQGRMIRYYA